MRDPGRIQPLLNELGEIWAKHPDMRLGQLLASLTPGVHPERRLAWLFYIEEYELLTALREFVRTHPPPASPSSQCTSERATPTSLTCSEESEPPLPPDTRHPR